MVYVRMTLVRNGYLMKALSVRLITRLRRYLPVLVLTLALTVVALRAGAAGIAFTQAPRDLELFGRDGQDSAQVVFAGTVSEAGHDSVRMELDRNGVPWRSDRARLVYQDGVASFRLSGRLHAELSEYAARFFLDDSLACSRESLVCGDVYLIDGQSNAEAQGNGTASGRSEWFRSFGTSDPDSAACRSDTSWGLAQGSVIHAHAAVGVWGLYLGLGLVQRYQVPVAVLNGALGGTAILEHLRNDLNPMDLSTIYGRLFWRAVQAGVAATVRAILWHQGERDTFPTTWGYYRQRFGQLWTAWHEDYGPLERVYGFQIRPADCGSTAQAQLREVQRTLPQYFPGLVYQSTCGLDGNDGCHYSDAGYEHMARWILPLVARDLYHSDDTLWIRAPSVVGAAYTNTEHSEIRVRFDSEVVWPADSLEVQVKDYFFLDDQWHQVASGRVDTDGRTVVLTLYGPSSASWISYLPNDRQYTPPWPTYRGPWIRNPRGVGAFSFWGIRLEDVSSVLAQPRESARSLRLVGSSPNPFLGATRVRFSITVPQTVRIDVFDAAGRTVRTLAGRWFPAGLQSVAWDGTDGEGNPAPPGRYFYRIRGRDASCSGELTLLR